MYELNKKPQQDHEMVFGFFDKKPIYTRCMHIGGWKINAQLLCLF